MFSHNVIVFTFGLTVLLLPSCISLSETCGNGQIDEGEDGGGDDLSTGTCSSEGFYDGELSCTDMCTFDVAECVLCGDGRVTGDEQCDENVF